MLIKIAAGDVQSGIQQQCLNALFGCTLIPGVIFTTLDKMPQFAIGPFGNTHRFKVAFG